MKLFLLIWLQNIKLKISLNLLFNPDIKNKESANNF